MQLIGEGTYGSVWLARAPNGTRVALKKIRKEKKEGFPITAIREIKILKALRHPNIVQLRDVVSSHVPGREGDVFMVFEFCDHDLTGLLESKVPLSDALCKYYLKAILEGLYHLHSRGILHRDIKGANILVSNNGDVRIADMGLARNVSKGGYTNRVVTLWYRAPELLWGASDYDAKIDMWSVGCLFAELLTRGTVLFPGKNTELDQLNQIYAVCGTPDEQSVPGLSKYKCFQQFTPAPKKRVLRQLFASQKSHAAVDLLDKLLCLNPAERLSAEQALDHEYFFEEPLPIQPHQHPNFQGNCHEYGSKQRRRGGGGPPGGGGGGGGAGGRDNRPQQQQQQMPGPYDRINVVPHSLGGGGGFQQLAGAAPAAAAPYAAQPHGHGYGAPSNPPGPQSGLLPYPSSFSQQQGGGGYQQQQQRGPQHGGGGGGGGGPRRYH